MSLQDLVRESTLSVRESIARASEQRTRLDTTLRDAKAQVLRQGEEIQAKQAIVGVRRQRVDQLDEELSRLQSNLARLKLEIEAKEGERNLGRQSVGDAEAEAARVKKDQRSAENRIEELQKEITALESERVDLQSRLGRAHVEALRKYLNSLRSLLGEARRVAGEIRSAREALGRLRDGRRRDGKIAALCEARDEWLRILKGANVPAVREAGQRELQRVEGELEALFPGAIRAEAASNRDAGIIEELFFRHQGSTGEVQLYLPFDHTIWERLERGDASEDLAWVVEFMWQLRAQLSLDWSRARLDIDKVLGALVLEAPAQSEVKEQSVEWTHVGGASSFVLSPLPVEIAEALDEPNTHQ